MNIIRIILRKRMYFIIPILFFFFSSTVVAKESAEKITISFSDLQLSEAIKEIEEKSSYTFFYDVNKTDLTRKVSLNVENMDINEALKSMLKHTNLTFEITNRQIALIPAQLESRQQTNIIDGVVLDNLGEPIIGANILIKGSPQGVISDVDGRFVITVSDNAVLQFSYIGYIPQEVPVKGLKFLRIVLIEDTRSLDEVVVVGYGTQKKVNLTGSIAAIKTSELENIPVSNLSNALAGRAPGVTITNNSGFAGASSNIRVRGSSGEPLYVINNVIRDKAAFDALDANEVEMINILKDAASASIYGSKAGNGVVLVTTKKGSMQKPMFQYKGSYTTTRTTRSLPYYSTTDELTFLNKAAVYQNSLLETPDPDFKAPYGQQYFDYFKDKSYNLNDLLWQNPWNQEHNISVNGGNEQITYYMMLGYHGEDGSYKNVDYNRFNLRSDVTAKITNAFKVNMNISANQRDHDRFYWPYDDPENMTLSDFYRTTFNWSKLRPLYVDKDGNPSNERTGYPVMSQGSHFGESIMGDNYIKTRNRDVEAILRLELDLGKYIKGLSTVVSGQYNISDKNRKTFVTENKSYIFQSASTDNIFIPGPVDPTKTYTQILGGDPYENIQDRVWLNNSYQFNWYVDYKRNFGKHGLSGLMVFEISESNGKHLYGKAEDLLTSSIDQIFTSSKDVSRRWFEGSESENARLSWIGRFNYNYDDRYIGEFSFREDGNAKFGSGRRWGFFPSASLAWRLSNESFMKQVAWLSNLKIRGSYGTTGDDSDTSASDGVLVPFGWRNKFQNATGYMISDSYYQGITVGAVPNPYLTWATLEVIDAGFDFGLLNNALTGDFDFFYKKKKDILQQRVASLPDTYGRGKAAENYAEQSWTGVEFSLRYNGTVRKINYAVFANMGYVKDKWLKFDEPDNLPAWKSRIGRPDGFIKGYIAEGIIRTQEQLDALPEDFTQFGQAPRLGQILYRDIRGANEALGADGKIDSNDWDYLSRRATPRINYGFGFNLEWNGLSVEALFQGVGAYDRMVKTRNGDGVFQVGDRPYFDIWAGDVWTPDNPNAKYPEAVGEWSERYGAAGSTFWLRNGAYMRLKNLNIAYILPNKWFNSIGINRLQVFGNGTNLFCISGMKEHDPEQETMDSFPIMRSFTVGLNINF